VVESSMSWLNSEFPSTLPSYFGDSPAGNVGSIACGTDFTCVSAVRANAHGDL